MYVCKVIGKIISTVKNEKLVVQHRAGPGGGSERPGQPGGRRLPVFAAADTIGCGEGNFVLVTRGSNARYACKCAEAPVDMAVVGILDGGQWGLS